MTHTLPTHADTAIGPLYWVAGKSDKTNSHIFKAAVYNSTAGADVPVTLAFSGVKAGAKAELTVLTGPTDPYGINDPYTQVNVVKSHKNSEIITAGDKG